MKKIQFLVGMCMLLLTITITSCDKSKSVWDTIFGSEQNIIVRDTTSTPSYGPYDVVAQRRMEIESMRLDSVYYSLPEPILIAIVDKIGVFVSHEDIASTYLRNKEYYDGVMTGIHEIKRFLPDSIPNKAPVDVTSRVIPLKKDTLK